MIPNISLISNVWVAILQFVKLCNVKTHVRAEDLGKDALCTI